MLNHRQPAAQGGGGAAGPPKAFVSLLSDKKESHRLDMVVEPNAWDNIMADVKAVLAKGCQCLRTMKKRHSSSAGADTSSLCATSSILPEGVLEDFVMWSREGPIPVKASKSGTIADLKQAIVMQLWISPRLDIKVEAVSGDEGVLDAVEDPSQITFATLNESDAIVSYAHSSFSDKHLVRRAAPRAPGDTLLCSIPRAPRCFLQAVGCNDRHHRAVYACPECRAHPAPRSQVLAVQGKVSVSEPLQQIRVRSCDMKTRRGVVVRPGALHATDWALGGPSHACIDVGHARIAPWARRHSRRERSAR